MAGVGIVLALYLIATAAIVEPAPVSNESPDIGGVCSSEESGDVSRWPRNVVPYMIGTNFTALDRITLINSMHAVENSSCVVFIPRTGEDDFVFFKLSTRCCSHSGKMGAGKQDVHFSRQCLEEGVSISRVLQTLVGDVSDQPVIPAKPDAEIPVIPARPEEKSGSEVSQSMFECTDSCVSCTLLQPPDSDEDDATSTSSGVISSINYPQRYPVLSNCVWKLIAPKDYFISLRFLADTDIEHGDTCQYDYLDVLVLDTQGELLIENYHHCGKKAASLLNEDLKNVELRAHIVVVHFSSDSTYSGAGFQLSYSLQRNQSNSVMPCSVSNGGCEHICVNDGYISATCSCRNGYDLGEDGRSCNIINRCQLRYRQGGCQQRCMNNSGSYDCYCKPGYRLAEDQRSCIKCGGEYNSSWGFIQSENYLYDNYPHEQNCKWIVHAWPNHSLNITITYLDILPTNRCTDDFLKVGTGQFPYQNRLCGHYKEITYIIDNSTYFRFRSRRGNSQYDGFRLKYSQVLTSDIGTVDRDNVKINGAYVPRSKRLWTAPSTL